MNKGQAGIPIDCGPSAVFVPDFCDVPGCKIEEVDVWWDGPAQDEVTAPKLCNEHYRALVAWYATEPVSDAYLVACDRAEAVLASVGGSRAVAPESYIAARRIERKEANKMRERIAKWIIAVGGDRG